MRVIIALIGSVALSGCATTAAPYLFAGNYYLGGDKPCKTWRAVSDRRIMCFDKAGKQSGYRDAMTSQQLQMWQHQAAQNQMQMQELNASIQRLGQSAQAWGGQQSQQYPMPQVQPSTPYDYNSNVTYTQVGSSLLGSNGVTYRRVGNSIIGSDGRTCQIVGQNIICR